MNDEPDNTPQVPPKVVEAVSEVNRVLDEYAASLRGRVERLAELEERLARDPEDIRGDEIVVPPGYDVTEDDCAEAVTLMQSVKREIKAICDRIEVGLIYRILVQGEFEVGEDRYYVGRQKKVKCASLFGTLERILTSEDGDLSRLAECLSANAFKAGETRKAIGDAGFAECFYESIELDLKTGKPRRVLASTNPKFQK